MCISCKVQALFQPDLQRTGRFPWEKVYSFMNNECVKIWVDSDVDFVSNYLLSELSKHDCTDPKVTAAIINLYSACRNRGMASMNEFDMFVSQLREQREQASLCDGVDHNSLNILDVINRGDVKFLQVLVRYGVIRHQESLDPRHSSLWNEILVRYLRPMMESSSALSTYQNASVSMFKELPGPNYREVNEEERIKYSRRLTILKVLLALVEPENRVSESDVIECLYLYFNAIPEPYVTVREMVEWMDFRHLRSYFFHKRRVVECFEKLKSLVVHSSVREPRTLEHLSRCAARKYLANEGVLPQVVSELNLPDAIKEYILISRTEPKFSPKRKRTCVK